MQQDPSHDRMDERLGVLRLVRERAERREASGKLVGRRWLVDDMTVVTVEHRNPLVLRCLQTPGCLRIVERAVGKDAMQFEDRLRHERWPHLAHELQRAVVVEDHPLAAVSRLAPGPQEILRNTPARACAFELARADGLLHERVDEVVLASLVVGDHDLRHRNRAAAALIDEVEQSLDRVGSRMNKVLAIRTGQRQRTQHRSAFSPNPPPPLLVSKFLDLFG